MLTLLSQLHAYSRGYLWACVCLGGPQHVIAIKIMVAVRKLTASPIVCPKPQIISVLSMGSSTRQGNYCDAGLASHVVRRITNTRSDRLLAITPRRLFRNRNTLSTHYR
ncbi:hypothetical protein BP00DRAFT_122983 [Aspergillus indologenus CBS 114.80]|uniref:Uncharacterized protein n=1 Tax=Aspergillus indologenus CBS 114.80 TaxID=1450541 RepID=A0A2V5I9K7_9EURO|nr:hypothetical protein BP00DRAFT_122983 [Aspergillus indologenus CBS 114.80]